MTKSRYIVFCGISTAIISVLAQVAIPVGPVKMTLQTFAVGLCALTFGWKISLMSAIVYALLGGIGVPVFAGFAGGLSVLFGPSGGFIFGFIPMAFLMGFFKKIPLKILSCFMGLICCYILGCTQFCLVTGRTFGEAVMLVCVPYVGKDIVSLVIAYFSSLKIKKYMIKFE